MSNESNDLDHSDSSHKHSQSFFLVKRFFQGLGDKSQKTLPDYYFDNNNSYNGASVHIVRSVILNCHMTPFLKVKNVTC